MHKLTPKQSEFAVFILQVVAATCLLGLAVDVVTANVAVEYFTVHHPHVVNSNSPWVMALVWGIGASWWFGVIAAVLLWWINNRRTDPLPSNRILKMVAKGLTVIWVIMMAIVATIFILAGLLIPNEKRRPSFESDRRIMAVAVAHQFEYVFGAVVTLTLMARIATLKVSKEPDSG